MTNIRSISIIIPALNEADNILASYKAAKSAAEALDNHEIIFVDDASSDGTLKIMQEIACVDSRVKVISHKKTMGLGASYKSGVDIMSCGYVAFVPGDNDFDAEELQKIFSKIPKYDAIIPYHVNMDEARSSLRILISNAYTQIANIISGRSIPYYNGVIAIRSDIVKDLGVRTNGFTYQLDIIVRALRVGISYTTVGIKLREKSEGKTSAFRLKNIIQVSLSLLRLIIEGIFLGKNKVN
jgi:glycosyltransferase involved in cell wall biosynthesis